MFAGRKKESSVWTYFLYDNDCDKSMCIALMKDVTEYKKFEGRPMRIVCVSSCKEL